MYYSEKVKKAINIMYIAHKDDVDKGGYPYVFHPFYLASLCDKEDEVIVCLLHDVIEDHSDLFNFEDFIECGFNDNIIEALKLLTHDKNVSYMDYVKKIKSNDLARRVKILDLKHNLDSNRLDGVENNQNNQNKKKDVYLEALEYLNK